MKRSFMLAVVVSSALLMPLPIHAAEDNGPPIIDHILIDVKDVGRSLTFYHDQLGLPVTDRSAGSAVLQAGNLKIFLWSDHWDWSPVPKGKRQPSGMYPHFVIPNVREVIGKMKKAGFEVVEEPEDHPWGTEGFVADPDGYVWSLISQKN